jgi:hypothetical protein
MERILAELYCERWQLEQRISELLQGDASIPARTLEIMNRDCDPVIAVCMHCGMIRDVAEDQWRPLEPWEVLPSAGVSHGLCPQCLEKHYSSKPI